MTRKRAVCNTLCALPNSWISLSETCATPWIDFRCKRGFGHKFGLAVPKCKQPLCGRLLSSLLLSSLLYYYYVSGHWPKLLNDLFDTYMKWEAMRCLAIRYYFLWTTFNFIYQVNEMVPAKSVGCKHTSRHTRQCEKRRRKKIPTAVISTLCRRFASVALPERKKPLDVYHYPVHLLRMRTRKRGRMAKITTLLMKRKQTKINK